MTNDNQFNDYLIADPAETHRDLQKDKGGRPRKAEQDKANQRAIVYLTKAEKAKLEKYVIEEETTESKLFRKLLKKNSII